MKILTKLFFYFVHRLKVSKTFFGKNGGKRLWAGGPAVGTVF